MSLMVALRILIRQDYYFNPCLYEDYMSEMAVFG